MKRGFRTGLDVWYDEGPVLRMELTRNPPNSVALLFLQVQNCLRQILIDQAKNPATAANSVIDIEFNVFAVDFPELFNLFAWQRIQSPQQAKTHTARRVCRVPPWTAWAVGVVGFPFQIIRRKTGGRTAIGS